MVVDDRMIGSLTEFWLTVSDEDFMKDAICVEFDCGDGECLYRCMCEDSSSMRRRIGKWCPYYCDKMVENLQKE